MNWIHELIYGRLHKIVYIAQLGKCLFKAFIFSMKKLHVNVTLNTSLSMVFNSDFFCLPSAF